MVIEVYPMSFGLLNEEKQNRVIDTFAHALQRLNNNQKCTILKTKKPMVLDGMMKSLAPSGEEAVMIGV